MKNRSVWSAAAALLAAAGLLTGCATTPLKTADGRRLEAEATIQGWSADSRIAAAALLEEFGAPDWVDSSRLVWHDKHLFKRVAVWDEIPGDESGRDIIEQAVTSRVPQEKRPELAAFSDGIRVSPDGRETAARADSVETSTLMLNLANEIVRDVRTPEEARDIYQRTLRLQAAGKISPYLQGLTFQPVR